MTFVSKAALATVLGLGATLAITAPADAQRNKAAPPAVPAPGQGAPQVGDAFRTAIVAGDAAFKAKDLATAEQQLAAAQAAMTAGNADEAYFANQLKLQIAQAKNDRPAMAAALDVLLPNPRLPEGDRGQFTFIRGQLALDAKQPDVALQHFERARQLGYQDPDIDLRTATVNFDRGNIDAGVASLDKAVAARKASNQPVPTGWYDLAVARLYKANKPAEASAWARRQLQEYPTQANWRKVLILFRDRTDTNGQSLGNPARLDVLRLMRETKSLADQNDYREYAVVAADLGLPYETVAVIDEGRSNGRIPASASVFNQLKTSAQSAIRAEGSLSAFEGKARSAANGRSAAATANAYLAQGNTAKAIELFQVAQQKGGVDADELNTRMGIAYARAGQAAQAKQSFGMVKSGPRAELANFWSFYVDQPQVTASTPPVGNS